jgi:flagellar biosynthesis/type III secretory pathway M-ring protein FliF/YscJ
MNPFHATICFCAVIVTAIAVYFFWQDQSDRRAYTMSQVEMRAERVQRELERMGIR